MEETWRRLGVSEGKHGGGLKKGGKECEKGDSDQEKKNSYPE